MYLSRRQLMWHGWHLCHRGCGKEAGASPLSLREMQGALMPGARTWLNSTLGLVISLSPMIILTELIAAASRLFGMGPSRISPWVMRMTSLWTSCWKQSTLTCGGSLFATEHGGRFTIRKAIWVRGTTPCTSALAGGSSIRGGPTITRWSSLRMSGFSPSTRRQEHSRMHSRTSSSRSGRRWAFRSTSSRVRTGWTIERLKIQRQGGQEAKWNP
mmetsp:Transcript_24855/g.63405  ORF Transcript_24855/g.63405 Transcript_24855/m.63405 type:complete len:214 (+) Transcript_24855:1288-1929(+)